MARRLRFCQAISEALDICLAQDRSVYVIGLGVPDPKGVFETTASLQQKHGPDRVMDMPASENGMTGVAIGSALVGMRPIMVHQRMDFALLAVDQLVNQAAKWYYMFGGQRPVPLVVRMIVGRGWGQGSQHAQSLQAWFAHIPGLKVIMPATPHDAKGLLIAAVEDDNPVICVEHRWLFNIEGPVPEGPYRVPLGKVRVIRSGTDLTIAAVSHMTIEALRTAEILDGHGIRAEVVDLRSLRPLDAETILTSVRKTGRLLVADTGWKSFGVSAEIVALVAERALAALEAPPRRIALPDCSSPATPALARSFFPGVRDLLREACALLGRPAIDLPVLPDEPPADVPDNHFTGPF